MEVDLIAGTSICALKTGLELVAQHSPGGEGPLGQVHEPRPGHAGQGNWEVVGHDGLIPSCSEDGGGIDLYELSGVDTSVILLWHVWSEFALPDHHAEVWGNRHAATLRSRGCRGASSLPHRGGVHRAEVPIEVAAPLPAALDGDAAILTRAVTLEFGPQIHRSETCHVCYQRRVWCRR
jgi:hypothetical protein